MAAIIIKRLNKQTGITYVFMNLSPTGTKKRNSAGSRHCLITMRRQ